MSCRIGTSVSRVRITVEVDHHYAFLLSSLFSSDHQTIVEQISLLILSYPNHLRSKIGIDGRECFSAVPGILVDQPTSPPLYRGRLGRL